MNLKGMANDSMAEQNYPQSISIREITEYNFDAVISMRRPDGEKFVAPNSYSLAQAWVYRNNNDVFPYAIYCGENPVGFLLVEADYEERKLCIWRIMFPEEYVCKGYGTAAIQIVLTGAKKLTEKFDIVALDCDPANVRARHVYEKLGFVETGEVNHGSKEMIFRLN